jgi:Phage virion morphogenesis family
MAASGIEVRGLDRAQRMIDELAVKARRPQRFELAAAEVLKRGFDRGFATEGAYYGERWQNLAAATLEDKARRGYPSDVLVRTGSLAARVAGAEVRKAAHGLAVGLGDDPIARFHQAGTGKMPARRLIDAARRDIAAIGRLGEAWMAGRGSP